MPVPSLTACSLISRRCIPFIGMCDRMLTFCCWHEYGPGGRWLLQAAALLAANVRGGVAAAVSASFCAPLEVELPLPPTMEMSAQFLRTHRNIYSGMHTRTCATELGVPALPVTDGCWQ